jgi:hypothetical protein
MAFESDYKISLYLYLKLWITGLPGRFFLPVSTLQFKNVVNESQLLVNKKNSGPWQ